MTTSKFMTSISTIPAESKYLSNTNFHTTSFRQFNNPYKQVLPVKFPKRKMRKSTHMNMLTQTMQNPEKSTIKNFAFANSSSRMFGLPERHVRYYKVGVFNSLQRQSEHVIPTNRSVQDIGAFGNRRKLNKFIINKPDPIIYGEKDFRHNSSLQKVWRQPRRHRDNGIKCEQVLQWKTKKSKTYLEMYKDGKRKNKETKIGKR